MRIAIDIDAVQLGRIMDAVNAVNADDWCGHPSGRLMVRDANLKREGERFVGTVEMSHHPNNDAGMVAVLDSGTVHEFRTHARTRFADVFGVTPTILPEPTP